MEMQAGGAKVHYELQPGEGSKVVLLHGWGCSTKLMEPVAGRLSGKHSVLSLDFPGHGESGRPPEPWGVPEYAACLKELLTALDFLPCSVIAHSFGARIAIWLAGEEQAPFQKLILTGAAGIKAPSTPENERRSRTYKRLKRWNQLLKKAGVFGSLPDRLEEQLRQKFGSADYNALDAEMRKTFVRIVQQDLTSSLPNIKQPTLLIFGDQDTETPLWMGKKMEELIPDAGLVTLNGTHFVYLEQLNAFITIVERFLSED